MYWSGRCSVKGLLIEENSDNIWNNTLNPEILVFSTSGKHYFKSQYLSLYMTDMVRNLECLFTG